MTSIFIMNNILENNEDLHEEFKTLLIKIEPHFVLLKSNLEKLLCREWLHKLFKTGEHEESLRNAYLTKLFEQLEKGKLKAPFNNLPKHKSPLLPLTIHNVSKPNCNIRDKKTPKKAEDSLISGVPNVYKTVDTSKSTKNHLHTKEIKISGNVCDEKTMEKVKETLITDSVNVHKAADTPKSTENHVHTKEIKMFGNVCDEKTMEKEEETLITDVVNVHKATDAPKSTENHVHTKEIKMFGNVCDEKTMEKEEETLITDVVNVDEIVDAPKPTENSVDDKKIITFADVHGNKTITDVVIVPELVDAPKSTDNDENSNEIKVNASSDQVKQLDINEIADNSKEVQWQKSAVDKSEGGDGLALNVETKLKLGSVEKLSNELKKKSELLSEQVQEIRLYADKNLINKDQIIVLNDELNKFKNDLEKMCDREAADELGASTLLKNILDKTTVLDSTIVSEMHRLKTMVEDACVSKKNNNFVVEQLKEVHRLKMDEKEKFHATVNRKLMVEISQLKEYVGKVEEEAMYKQLSSENDYEDDCSST